MYTAQFTTVEIFLKNLKKSKGKKKGKTENLKHF